MHVAEGADQRVDQRAANVVVAVVVERVTDADQVQKKRAQVLTSMAASSAQSEETCT